MASLSSALPPPPFIAKDILMLSLIPKNKATGQPLPLSSMMLIPTIKRETDTFGK